MIDLEKARMYLLRAFSVLFPAWLRLLLHALQRFYHVDLLQLEIHRPVYQQ